MAGDEKPEVKLSATTDSSGVVVMTYVLEVAGWIGAVVAVTYGVYRYAYNQCDGAAPVTKALCSRGSIAESWVHPYRTSGVVWVVAGIVGILVLELFVRVVRLWAHR